MTKLLLTQDKLINNMTLSNIFDVIFECLLKVHSACKLKYLNRIYYYYYELKYFFRLSE